MNTKQRFSSIFCVSFALLIFSGCTKKDQPTAGSATATGVKQARELNLTIWANYLTPEQQKKFTDKTGIKLNVSNFSSNEELLAKLQSGASGIDVAIPSDYMVQILSKVELLEPIKKDLIPNAKDVSADFLRQQFDPENHYSLPYAWSTAGIAFHRDLFKGQINSWKELFESKEVDGKYSLLDDAREVLGAGLKSLGLSLNTTNKSELLKAKDVIQKASKRVKMFRSETVDALVNKEVALAQAYSTDANQASAKSNGKIVFLIPSDGGSFSIDNMVIVKGSPHMAEAHEFINFILSIDNNVEFVKSILAGPVLSKTRSLLPKELQENRALFPPKEVLAKLEKIQDLGEFTQEYDKAWTEIKSQ